MASLLKATLLLFGLMGLMTTSVAAQSESCVQSRTIGNWENPFAGNRSDLTKLEVRAICNDQTVPHIQIKAYTACAPRDCTWGRSIAHRFDDTSFQVSYRTFFAKRTVTVSINGKRMDAQVFDDYHDRRKPDEMRKFVLWKK
ncbi:hypothetical protein SAMN04515647_0839 [Cohaesibacter sp. ES.047]|uniref:hypothetical protein n=1 Tax=Cohaesibacter sp. ES.047 TaxID=1798205 RepID=UPI000BC0501B|nr:hypothetical protein [Cohaesibacter sp. ES.047]SNY90668.1 hypothetical protein SAMN04515647_0839 [Cohaesibacter sp. ES.047]